VLCVFRVDFTQQRIKNKKKQQDLQEKMVVNLAVFLYFLLFSIAFENLPEWHSIGPQFNLTGNTIISNHNFYPPLKCALAFRRFRPTC